MAAAQGGDGWEVWGEVLWSAAWLGDLAKVKALLGRDGAMGHIDDADIDGWTALHCAAYRDHLSVVVYLVDKGADTEVTFDGDTPLTQAAYDGYFTVAEYLVSCGADVNGGGGPLRCACLNGHHKVAVLQSI